QKQAVIDGGGVNHRFGLHDAVLVKDNHLGLGGGLEPVLQRLAAGVGHLVRVEVEVDTIDQLRELLDFDAARVAAGDLPVVHAVLLDNMGPALVGEGVGLVRKHPVPLVVEVSGGVTEESVRALAEAGPDVISVGALTHSLTCLDLGLDLVG
ncbi:MAG TPA: nicotinate-nucleotide diphosphorylase (carboxylating), partial [Marmoricola sp.]|nr:nicotinate-nucleotide diphosphorylase (carboxylating) [Marmoricola sp.]